MFPTPPLALLLALAPNDPPVPAHAGTEWTALDTTAASLAKSLDDDEGPSLWGFANITYGASGDLPASSNLDYSAVAVDAARIYVDGEHSDKAYRLSVDFFNGAANLVDAYASFGVTEGARVTAGQFRTPFLRTSQVEANRNILILPTRNALFYRVRDTSRQGVMVAIEHGPLRWNFAAQNGFAVYRNGLLLLSSRLEVDIIGEGVGLVEGAYGAPEAPHMTAGIAYSDDESGSGGDSVALAADVALTMARFYFQLEALDYGADYTGLDVASGIILPTELAAGRGNTNPISLTASHLVPGDEWEFAARYDDFDDGLGREVITVGVNYYLDGHDAKVQANFSTENSSGADADVFGIGLSLSF